MERHHTRTGLAVDKPPGELSAPRKNLSLNLSSAEKSLDAGRTGVCNKVILYPAEMQPVGGSLLVSDSLLDGARVIDDVFL